MAETAVDWLERVAAALGVAPPDAAEREALLDLAGVAARASERIAAPLSCWLAGRAGLDPSSALGLVRRLAQTEPAQTEPAQTEPAQTEPAQTEPAQIDEADPGT